MDPAPTLGALETKVMEALWDADGAWRTVGDTVADLEAAHPRRWAYNTVMTVMGRLADKGYLERRRDGRAHTYRPAVARGELGRFEAARAADGLLAAYGAAAAAGIADAVSGRPDLADRLRAALDRLDGTGSA